MKCFIKKIYFILLLTTVFILNTKAFSKDVEYRYSKDNISNYLSGVISSKQNHSKDAFKHLNKIQSLGERHHNFNIEFIRTLILLKKFGEAFNFAEDAWSEDTLFFEADLLLGLDSLRNKNYTRAQKHFERLNKAYSYNLSVSNFLGNILISWIKASENNEKESFDFVNKIPDRYENLKKIQNSFLQCYFDSPDTQNTFKMLIDDDEYNFSRYNFFLVNYLLFEDKEEEAIKLITGARKKHNSNLLLKQSEDFIISKNKKRIKKIFSCKNPEDVLAEIFYVIANLYSSQKDYQLSNFYLNISFFLNEKFTPNNTLLAENLFYQKKYDQSKKVYNSLKSIGPVYSWYASKSIAVILQSSKDFEYLPTDLEKEFNLLPDPDFLQFYELANFYKDYEYYEKSIKYYSLALKNIKKDHSLIPKILDRRGSSYERIGEWENAEKDLKESLSILPNQPYVLNYLAYSWVEKGINIDEALEMLRNANKLRENDGYILDSLGWAHFANKNYVDAEKFLRQAVELMPTDPIINDHYGDALWMLNKNIQARYLWQHVLNLDKAESELKESVEKKLIFGINKNL